jgi:hypothetical protein
MLSPQKREEIIDKIGSFHDHDVEKLSRSDGSWFEDYVDDFGSIDLDKLQDAPDEHLAGMVDEYEAFNR